MIFLRNTGNAIQQNVGDPYAKALTRAARTGNYNPFDIVANAAMNRKAYYTQQLMDGGYLDGNGNVRLGVPIRLKKRK